MIKNEILSTQLFFEQAKKDLSITKERLEILNNIAKKTVLELNNSNKISLNFICTHNSRRSQMGQVWSFYAANYFKIKNIYSLSGGTEVTAFHKNTVKTLQKVGFEFNLIDFNHQNPKYFISFQGSTDKILGYSKKYDNQENSESFIAITTCNHADENCPFIPEALHRFHLPYIDPKSSDDTPEEEEKYLATNKQIASEMYYLFEKIAHLIA